MPCWIAVAALPPWKPETAEVTPLTWLNTPSTPQKHPPAKIAVLRPFSSLATRVAAELGGEVGGLVGYETRHDRRVGRDTATHYPPSLGR